MAPLILNGLEVRTRLTESLKVRISQYTSPLGLIVFSFGTDERSQAYVEQKIKFGALIGVKVFHVNLPQETNMDEALTAVHRANNDYESQGIIIQLPVPSHLDADALCDAINPGMDVDGLHPVNQGLLVQGRRGIMSATAKAVITLLDHYQIPIEGKNIVVIGRSSLVGKPLALALVARDATVTIAHTRTADIPSLTRSADMVITAIGKEKFLKAEDIKEGAVVVDIGISKNSEENKLVGDVDFKNVAPHTSAITPVPGGVGPMTVYCLFENLCEAYEARKPLGR